MNEKEWKNLENHYLFHETLNTPPVVSNVRGDTTEGVPTPPTPTTAPERLLESESTPTKPAEEVPKTETTIKKPLIPNEQPIKTIEAPKGYILVRDPTEAT